MAGQTFDRRPTVLNILLYSGDGFSFKLECVNDDNVPIDVSGAIAAQIRADRLNPESSPLATFTASLVDAYLGIIVLSLTGVQTQALVVPGEETFNGVWDVQWTPPGAQPLTICQGTVECKADVTR